MRAPPGTARWRSSSRTSASIAVAGGQHVPDRADLTELLRQLEHDPRPLLFGPGKLGIIWSAKAACTTLLLWYLWRCDLLQAARAYDAWPHKFRQHKLYASDTYRAWAAEVERIRLVLAARGARSLCARSQQLPARRATRLRGPQDGARPAAADRQQGTAIPSSNSWTICCASTSRSAMSITGSRSIRSRHWSRRPRSSTSRNRISWLS